MDTDINRYYSTIHYLDPDKSFRFKDWSAARDEARKGVYVHKGEFSISSPRIQKITHAYMVIMGDIFQQASTPIIQSSERMVQYLENKEHDLETKFYRLLHTQNELPRPPFDDAYRDLIDCQNECVRRMKDQLIHLEYAKGLLRRVYEHYVLRITKYTEQLSKRIGGNLRSVYTEADFDILSDVNKRIEQQQRRVEEKVKLIKEEKKLYGQRVAQLRKFATKEKER
jgi:hypothetical protein